ncbi:hypothetical protein ACJDU8_21600 [Clostridium sp. WILCCON 0269]|uniref:Uncharacterized protein n=1 Tax=Candidatus Clostridium eludens TaxID=3381663 RepID=A0ABW8SR35_9CLOT
MSKCENEILKNDNVNYDYQVFVCLDQERELDNIMATVSAFIRDEGYKFFKQIKHRENIIIIISRKKS